jgi:hypothetical protein
MNLKTVILDLSQSSNNPVLTEDFTDGMGQICLHFIKDFAKQSSGKLFQGIPRLGGKDKKTLNFGKGRAGAAMLGVHTLCQSRKTINPAQNVM